MKIYFSVVAQPNPHTRLGRLARTPSGSFCWDKEDPNPSHYAVIAQLHDGQLVGIQKFDVKKSNGKNVLVSNSTYVWPLYRELNIAHRLWATALEKKKISKVEVYVVSDRGKTLVESLRAHFPKIDFVLSERDGRPLRKLKGKGKGKVQQAA